MLPHLLTYFEIQKYYQSGPKLKGVHSKNNLPTTIQNGTYIVDLECKSIGKDKS